MMATAPYQGPTVSLTVEAPAKINLCLHVLGRRADGYHEVAMLMQAVSLMDAVRIDLAPDPGCWDG
jgi:4-diphosphocytidyl-2-C-methyl-D-erythritol kinase